MREIRLRGLIPLALFGITWIVPKKLCEKLDEGSLRSLVGWVMDNPSLLGTWIQVRRSLGIPEVYNVFEEEKESAGIILKEYQEDLRRKCAQKPPGNLENLKSAYGNQISFIIAVQSVPAPA